MAAPTFNETGNMTLISAADATGSGWSIDDTDTEIKVEGVGSHFDAIRQDGTLTFTFGTAQDMSATDTHIRLWMQHTFPANLNTKANGGIQLFISDGTNTANWYVGGSDTHKGTWEVFQADLSATPDLGTLPTLTAITTFGFVLDHLTAARNVVNTYWDISWYGIGIEFYGGTTVDKVTWNTLSIADTGTTAGKNYGIIEWIRGGAYYMNHALYIGDSASTNNTYFDGTNETIVFYAEDEKNGAYKIQATGNATGTTDIDLSGCTILSASTPFLFDMSSANLTTLTMDGATLTNASDAIFKSGQTVNNTKFTEVSTISVDGATLDGCTAILCGAIDLDSVTNSYFKNGLVDRSTAASAILADDLSFVTGNHFISDGSNHAVELSSLGTGSMTWNNTLSGYDTGSTGTPITPTNTGNEAIYVNVATGTLTINVASGATIPSVRSAGATITIPAAAYTLTLTNIVEGTSVVIVNSSTRVLLHSETAGATGIVTYVHGGGEIVDIMFTHLDYDPNVSDIFDYTLPAADSTTKINMLLDPNYSNPA